VTLYRRTILLLILDIEMRFKEISLGKELVLLVLFKFRSRLRFGRVAGVNKYIIFLQLKIVQPLLVFTFGRFSLVAQKALEL
jgi:hypothetical protein